MTNGAQVPADDFAPEEVALRPRHVRFDWSTPPLHWIPGDPYASHAATALNLFLPVAERWFSTLLSDALEYVRDERLREEIIGFIDQEAVHARTHDDVLVQYLRRHGIEPEPFLQQLEWVASQYELQVSRASPDHRRRALASGTHALSAAEHFTGVLGQWALNNRWDELDADPTLSDLYRWHGAEEVEHRHVSFNVAKHFGMDYFAQAAAGVLVSVVFFTMALRGVKFLVRADPALPNCGYVRIAGSCAGPQSVAPSRRSGSWSAPGSACFGVTTPPPPRAARRRRSPTWPPPPRPAPSMAESRRIRLRRSLDGLLRPYSGSPPPGLYRPETSDVLIRLAGTAVPHFLSVVMRLGGDREPAELPAAVNRRTARVVGRRRVARDPDVIELTLADPDRGGPGWHPGAHIDLHLPSGRMRQYSLCGDPDRRHEYRIAIRRIPTGSGGSVEAQNLSIGQAVEISDPRNAFMMPLPGAGSSSERLRFIAGGIGITPILPMVRLAERRGVPWSLCYTGRHRDSLPFLDEVLALGDKVSVRTDDEHGLPTAAELLGGLAARTAVYACGPPPMLDLVRAAVPADSSHELHVERFSPRPVVEGRPFEIQLARSAEVVQVGADQSALSALRAARPDLSYSCQQGFCGTCVQRVVAGEVEHRDTLLTDGQRELGQMLVCVSRAHADGARLILDL